MLGFLQGKILSKALLSNQCVLLVQGVGYEVSLSSRTFENIREGEETSLWIHTHLREDLLCLYGFSSDEERQLFRILLGVSGLGPRNALSLLSEHGAQKLVQLVLAKESSAISKAHGVGKTLAQRMVIDLQSKLEKFVMAKPLMAVPLAKPVNSLRDDLASALSHLGYTPQKVQWLLDKLFEQEALVSQGFEACLKQALSELSGKAMHV